MKEYEVVHEIFNQCSGNQMRVFQRMLLFIGYKLATLAIWLPSGTVVP